MNATLRAKGEKAVNGILDLIEKIATNKASHDHMEDTIHSEYIEVYLDKYYPFDDEMEFDE